MRKSPRVLLAIVGIFILTEGCSQAWRPSMESVREVPPVAVIDLADYLPEVPHSRVYLRSDLRHTEEAVTSYERHVERMRRRDGVFSGLELGDLTRYFVQSEDEEPERYFKWPVPQTGRWLGFFMEFDPPLVYMPATVRRDAQTQCRSSIRLFDFWGHRLRPGTVERIVRVEGFESIVADKVSYPECLRLVAETRVRIPWSARVNLTEYLWLARGIGEVRRVERLGVLVFPFVYFHEAFAYELAAEQESAVGATHSRPSRGPAWARLAILLDRFLPRLRVGGVLVEHTQPTPQAAEDGSFVP